MGRARDPNRDKEKWGPKMKGTFQKNMERSKINKVGRRVKNNNIRPFRHPYRGMEISNIQ